MHMIFNIVQYLRYNTHNWQARLSLLRPATTMHIDTDKYPCYCSKPVEVPQRAFTLNWANEWPRSCLLSKTINNSATSRTVRTHEL